MATRGSTARQRTASESTARGTGEPSARQIENEARVDSEVTPGDTEDVMANQRAFIQELVEKQAAMQAEMAEQQASMQAEMAEQRASMQAQLEAMESRQPPANSNVLPVAPMAPAAHPRPFKMRNPAPFCGGADDLDRFLTHVKRLFKSHPQQFPRGEPDQVEYAIDFLGSWKENVDEGLRKTQMTHPNQWASELIKAEAECLDDWDLFETEIREMYGDPDRQLDASTRACLEIVQGASDANETVTTYSNRMRSMWREAGWNAGSKDVQRVLYDMVWAGLRPGIKARIKPFAKEDGRFASIDELFKKAQDVEIRSNRDKRAGTTQNQPAITAEKKHANNGGNSGNNGGKDKRKRPYHDTPSTPSHNHSRQNLPPAP
jgi:hypothetical protein